MPSFLGLDAVRARGLRLKFIDQPDRRDTRTGIAGENAILMAADETRLKLLQQKCPGRLLPTISQTMEHLKCYVTFHDRTYDTHLSFTPYYNTLPRPIQYRGI